MSGPHCLKNLGVQPTYIWCPIVTILPMHACTLTPSGFPKEQLESYPGCLEAIAAMTSGEPLREDELILIGELPDEEAESGQFYSVLRTELLKLIGNPVLSLIQLREEEREMGVKFSRLFAAAEYKNNAKVSTIFSLIYAIITLPQIDFRTLQSFCIRS